MLLEEGADPNRHQKIVWVSDDNPRRTEQMALFDHEQRAGHLVVPGIPGLPPTGIKLDPNNSGMEKVIVQSEGGVGPDIFDCYDAKQLAAYVRSGVALDVTDALKARGLKLDDTWPCMKPVCIYNGRMYGRATNTSVNALWLNTRLFQEAGVPLPTKKPWTWQEFLPLAQKLTQRDANGHIVRYGFLADWYNLWQTCLVQWGGHYYSADGTRCVLDSPEAIAGVQFAHDLIYKYHVVPGPVEEASLSGQGGWGQGTIKWFGADKGAIALGGRWWLCTLRDQTHPIVNGKPETPTLNLRVVECPHGPQRVFPAAGKATLINAASKHIREALDFYTFMDGKPYNDLINAQADGLGPIKRFAYSPEYLHNPEYPEEQDNDVWRDIIQYGVAEETSDFVEGQAVQRILDVQLDLVKSDQKSAADALHTAAQKINAEIQRMIAADPTLRSRYQLLVGHSAAQISRR